MSLNNKEIQLEDVIQIIKEKLNSGGTVTFTPHEIGRASCRERV